MDKLVMIAPEGMSEVSYMGTVYTVFEGLVHVPAEAAADLIAHGLTVDSNLAESPVERCERLLFDIDAEIAIAEQDVTDLREKRDAVDKQLDGLLDASLEEANQGASK